MVTMKGARTHIVHYISALDIDIMQKEMVRQQANVHVTPEYVVRQLFNFKKQEISKVFRDHFKLGPGFEAQYNDYHGTRNLEMALNHRKIVAQSPSNGDSVSATDPAIYRGHQATSTLTDHIVRAMARSVIEKQRTSMYTNDDPEISMVPIISPMADEVKLEESRERKERKAEESMTVPLETLDTMDGMVDDIVDDLLDEVDVEDSTQI